MNWRIALAMILLLVWICDAKAESVHIVGPKEPIPLTYFGLHAHRLVHPGRNGIRSAWPNIPFGSLRTWDAEDVKWGDIEPTKGKFYFYLLDALVNLSERHGVEVLYTLGSTPQWASVRPEEGCGYGKGCAAEPRDMADWENYVRRVVERYKGRIHYYEMWNEPSFSEIDGPPSPAGGGYFSGSLKTFLTMTEIAHRVIHEIDPNARLLGPAAVGDAPRRFGYFLQNGGGKYIDIASFHFYSRTPEGMLTKIRSNRDALDKMGLKKMALWDTEDGYDLLKRGQQGQGTSDPEEHAGYVARTLILGAVAGLDRLFWYSWEINLAVGNGEGQIANNSGHAYAQTVRWLVGARIKECHTDNGQLWTCELIRNKRRAWLVWLTESHRKWLPPRDWMILEVQQLDGSVASLAEGVAIGPAPVLLKSDNEPWEPSMSAASGMKTFSMSQEGR